MSHVIAVLKSLCVKASLRLLASRYRIRGFDSVAPAARLVNSRSILRKIHEAPAPSDDNECVPPTKGSLIRGEETN